jgi:hypothetical protein
VKDITMPTATPTRIIALSASRPLAVAAASPTSGKPARVSGVAYSGGPLTQPWADSVVVDLAGLDTSKSTYHLLKDHGWTNEDNVARLGTCTVAKSPTELRVDGSLFTHSALAERIKLDALAGAPFEFSIRADVVASREVPAGEVVRVNGRTFAGPITVVTQARLREISIVELGADPATQFSIAARARRVSAADGATSTKVRIADITHEWLKVNKPEALVPPSDSGEYDDGTTPTKVRIEDITHEWLKQNKPEALVDPDAGTGADPAPETAASASGWAHLYPGARGHSPESDWANCATLRADWGDDATGRRAFLSFAAKQTTANETYLVPRLGGPAAAALEVEAKLRKAGKPRSAGVFAGATGMNPLADWGNAPALRAHWGDTAQGLRAFLAFAAKQTHDGETYLIRRA